MPRQADLELARRDPAIRSMQSLFTPTDLVTELAPHWGATGAELRYLRYKPGASLLATVAVRRGAEERLVQAVAFGAGAADKLEKIARAGAKDDVGLGAVIDLGRQVAVADASADRALPGVVGFLRSAEGTTRPLVYKPGRRWVARHTAADGERQVVRVHRPSDAATLVERHRAVAATGLPVPAMKSPHLRVGIITLAWVPGTALDRVGADLDHDALRTEAGRLLAGLHHGNVPAGLPGARRGDDLRAAVTAVGHVMPELADDAHRIAERILAALAGRRQTVLVHGDFSADQVIVRPDLAGACDHTADTEGDQGQAPVTILDLDRVRSDDPMADLASWYAAQVVTAPSTPAGDPEEVLAALLAGYRAAGGTVDTAALRWHAAAALLQRAVEPFRYHQDWPDRVAAIITAADQMGRG